MTDATTPNSRDLLAVRSRISWGAIAAGAMVALATYVVLTLLGLAVGIEVAVRGSDVSLGAPAAIYTLVTLLVAMFFGGWATSRLAVGESKMESVLYGIILWGVLFTGLFWLIGHGVRVGFGALVGTTTGAYALNEDTNRLAATVSEAAGRPDVQQATRQATWWSLLGVLVSMATAIIGSLTGSGEMLQLVPILGVRRPTRPLPAVAASH